MPPPVGALPGGGMLMRRSILIARFALAALTMAVPARGFAQEAGSRTAVAPAIGKDVEVALADGSKAAGKLLSTSAGQLVVTQQGREREIPWANVRQIQQTSHA